MKKVSLIALLVLYVGVKSYAESTPKELSSGYYMVVAAYAPSAENLAIKLVQKLNDNNIDANYGFSYAKNLIFVYSANYNTRAEAIKSIKSERERTGEEKAWVYVYKSENENNNNEEEVIIPAQEAENNQSHEEAEVEMIKNDTILTEALIPSMVEEKDTVVTEIPISHKGLTYLHIDAFNATTGKPILIDFEVIDLARKTHIASAKSMRSFMLKEPTSASKMIQVQSNDIGWQRQSFDFKYYEPIIDSMSIFLDNLGDTTFVTFEMSPIKKGDIVTLYQVFFFKDASIMLGKSEYELDQIVDLMNNNPDINIVIHGHTNGNAAGKIISLKKENDTDFFNLTGDHREISGSAKNLSFERAYTVGAYLKSHGIDTSRFEAKGWGGKKMIYDKHSPKAKYNVRVEIEIVGK